MQTIDDLNRLSHVLAVLARHGFGSVLRRLPLSRIPGLGPVVLPDASGTDEDRAAERAVAAIEELGTTFIKFGQVLSTRPDLMPAHFIQAFQKLQDRVPPFSFDECRSVIEAELGRAPDELFESVEPLPLASASIAQVHRARLRSGEEVVIKVQRPGIEQTVATDVRILRGLAGLLEESVEVGVYSPAEMVNEFERAIWRELDFAEERNSAEIFRQNHSELVGVQAPRTWPEYSTRRVLTLSFVAGEPLRSGGGFPVEVAMEHLIESSYRQIFVDGFFHGDPHPGNLLVDPSGRVTFLDFGLMGRLSRTQQDLLVELFTGIIFHDPDQLARALYRSAASRERVELRALSAEVAVLLDRYGSLDLKSQRTVQVAEELLALALSHGLKLPPEFAILARTVVTLDGIARDLVPDWNMIERVSPLARRLLTERYAPERMQEEALRTGMQLAHSLRDLPTQLDQLMMDASRGRLQLRTESPQFDRLEKAITQSARTLSFALGVSAFLLSASILAVGGLESMRLSRLISGAALLALVAALALLAALLYELYLSRWLGRRRIIRWLGSVLRSWTRRPG